METTSSGALDKPSYEGSDSQGTKPASEQGRESIMEKHDVGITSTTCERQHSESTNSTQTTNSEGSTWRTTFLRIAPLTGVACLIAAIASIVAALGILVGSRGAAISTWKVCQAVSVER